MLPNGYTTAITLTANLLLMRDAQVTAWVAPSLKKEFMKSAKQFGLPLSWLFTVFIRMIVEGKIVPAMVSNDIEDTETIYRKAKKDYENGINIVDGPTAMKKILAKNKVNVQL